MNPFGHPIFSERKSCVRVFRSNKEHNKYDLIGMGILTFEYYEKYEAVVVVDEESDKTLMTHRININCKYSRDEDSIISWNEPRPRSSTRWALSFGEVTDCNYVWLQILNKMRNAEMVSLAIRNASRAARLRQAARQASRMPIYKRPFNHNCTYRKSSENEPNSSTQCSLGFEEPEDCISDRWESICKEAINAPYDLVTNGHKDDKEEPVVIEEIPQQDKTGEAAIKEE